MPPRTWRPMLLWTAAILAAAALAGVIGTAVGSVRETRGVLARYATGMMGGSSGLSGEEAVRVLGGPRAAALKLRLYLWPSRKGIRNGNMAAALLGYCGKPALPALRAALRHADGGVRAYAISSLGMLGPDAAPAVPELVPSLSNDNWLVRIDVANALGQIGPGARDAVPALESALKDEDASVRAAAAEALKRIRGEEPAK